MAQSIGRTVDENGMRSSYQSSDIGQSFRESNVICDECITQKVRDSGYVGAYSGVQVKPAVEVILVVSKGKTLTWLDDCRIPYQSSENLKESKPWSEIGHIGFGSLGGKQLTDGDGNNTNEKGRFPANLLVSDDVLNSYSRYFSLDKWSESYPFLIVPKASKGEKNKGLDTPDKLIPVFNETKFIRKTEPDKQVIAEYLKQHRLKKALSHRDIDEFMSWNTFYSWIEGRKAGITLPIAEDWFKLKEVLDFDDKYDKIMTEMIEVNKIQNVQDTKFPQVRRCYPEPRKVNDGRKTPIDNPFQRGETLRNNFHPTVKPLKLFSYLITMGSRENDIILDPFCGSGTTLIAANNLARKYIGIEINKDYLEIAKHRLLPHVNQTKLLLNKI